MVSSFLERIGTIRPTKGRRPIPDYLLLKLSSETATMFSIFLSALFKVSISVSSANWQVFEVIHSLEYLWRYVSCLAQRIVYTCGRLTEWREWIVRREREGRIGNNGQQSKNESEMLGEQHHEFGFDITVLAGFYGRDV